MEISWVAVGQIILLDLVLGGDNAIIIALASRHLPPKLRLQAILWGTCGAVVARILLSVVIVFLLTVPYIKLLGGLLLFWISIKLTDHRDDHDNIPDSQRLWSAIKTIMIADIVMSLDNVLAIASAAEQAGQHRIFLIILGILVSIPIMMWGSTVLVQLIQRCAFILILAAALLGYLAGAMIASDPALQAWVSLYVSNSVVGLISAIGTVMIVLFKKTIL